MPVSIASALGGSGARLIGPWMPVSGRADDNLRRAFPALSAAERRRIVARMWENLGRVLAEYPHLRRIWDEAERRIELVGTDILDDLRRRAGACVMISAHFGNWELLPVAGDFLDVPMTSVYRRPNNPALDRLIRESRHVGSGELVPKGRDGARALVGALGRGRTVALLIDQKMNDGISVPFFGRMAMTAPAVAQLALRFGCPIVPARMERRRGVHFRLTVYPPIDPAPSGDREADVRRIMTELNRLLEAWIRERPEQWLWLHRRWPD